MSATVKTRFSPFTRFVLWSGAGLLALGMAAPFVVQATMTPEERAISDAKFAAERALEQRRSALSTAALLCSEAIKRRMNNPASFEKVGHTTDGKNVIVTFRGTNAFNAVVTNTTSCPLPQ